MSEESGSQTVTEQQDDHQTAISDAFSAFGLDTPSEAAAPENEQAEMSEPPAIEEAPAAKTIKVKHNKEEIEVDISDDKLPEYVQKALALDKERSKKTELEKSLERAAKLNGFDKTEDYLANLDQLEQQAKQRQQDQFKDLHDQLREEAEYAGIDPEKLDAFLDAHPLLQEANKAIAERQRADEERSLQVAQQAEIAKWGELFTAYPDLVVPEDGVAPDWLTPDMSDRIERGYDPKDAYELAHRNTITAQTRKQAEQKAIKDQRLGLRAQVEIQSSGEPEAEVPTELSTAFSLFGLDPKAAKKYVKK
ncbi:hypothetical protein BBD42_13105 [Paenibacillus sp. BIHB 4019]|uniref:Uncharacterized protein n=1 Tax=Paenibacillus sp. BIHB 4019 TaxID=1870819 RepID=A0A1B2DHV0_9BACL|nr:hypothetical protein [Paenibacillus sp. BIHB 4019]ANY67307.1 hypothetical protein BBD42_13105 [Paenibacillus sp. BIHB 4019]